MKRFKYILFIGFSETACPFRFLVCGRGFLHKILILTITLNLFSCFVRTNNSSAWTARIYAEGKDLGTSSVMIGVASEAYRTPADLTDQNSVTLYLNTPEKESLSEDIREEGNKRYAWFIYVNPMGNIVPLDLNRTATLRWDFYSFSLFDLRNPASLVVKLRDASDPISHYLWEHFSPTTRQLLSQYDGSDPPMESLQVTLIDELNDLLQDPNLYDEERFANVNLSQEAQLLIAQNPEGEDLKCLNRLLLDEAYPYEIVRNPKFKSGTFELIDSTDGTIVVADMKTTESYQVKGLRYYFTVVFTEAENDEDDILETIHIESDNRGGCFIAMCNSQK